MSTAGSENYGGSSPASAAARRPSRSTNAAPEEAAPARLVVPSHEEGYAPERRGTVWRMDLQRKVLERGDGEDGAGGRRVED